MGVPQKRERVFFLAMRKDIAESIDAEERVDMFNPMPWIDMVWNEKEIFFKEVYDCNDKSMTLRKCEADLIKYKKITDSGLSDIYKRLKGKDGYFSHVFLRMESVCSTITANSGGQQIIYDAERHLNNEELCKIGSFPLDYKYLSNKPRYLVGMSVPPVMVAQIATRIKKYWLEVING